jgi:sec-independent protein translocase protein TatC
MTKKKNNSHSSLEVGTVQPTPTTFHDHFVELKGRLFWVAVYFAIFSGLVYPYFAQVSSLLMSPLGGEQLYYTTPSGGLSFIIKVCMFVGLIATMPVAIFHIYKFIMPIMGKKRSHAVASYTIISFLLAIAGVLFAYLVSLPAALHFLTNFDIAGVSPLLAVDSYLSFITAYLVAGALLFQLPLLMLMIDGVTPLKPKKLMSYQRQMIVGSFVIAAVVSPTPDVINQSLLAAPIVVMYQVGVMIIAYRRHKDSRSKATVHKDVFTMPSVSNRDDEETILDDMITSFQEDDLPAAVHHQPASQPQKKVHQTLISDIHRSQLVIPKRNESLQVVRQPLYQRRRSVDGIL